MLPAALAVLLGYLANEKFELVGAGREFYARLMETFSRDTYVRGTIYDRNLKQLAVTMERVSVFARTREIDSIRDTAAALGAILQLDGGALQDQLESGALRLWVAENIRQDQEEALKKLDLAGIYLQKDSKRYYPNSFEASHLIGYVEDGFGLAGAEFYYDRILASRKLQKKQDRNSLRHGQDLVLTLDLKIQSILEAMVRDIAASRDAYRVMAYLQESGSGEIISGVHFPSFDPNNFTKYSKDVLKNYFLEPIYLPPGFRRLLRDGSLLYAKEKKQEFSSAWSLVSSENDLGSQLQFWNLLGFDDDLLADFSAGGESAVRSAAGKAQAPPGSEHYGTTPEALSPMQLLNGCTILLGHGRRSRPRVVKKIIDVDTDLEISLDDVIEDYQQSSDQPADNLYDIDGLFGSQAGRLDSATQYLSDSIMVHENHDGFFISHVDDLTLARIPAGSDDLFLLVLVQKFPRGVDRREAGSSSTASIIDQGVERISVLQQVALSVADVVEPELLEPGNYQATHPPSSSVHAVKQAEVSPVQKLSTMPDLKGLSLRKSLRLLEGSGITIRIEGTGRVVGQTPPAGAPLNNVQSCLIRLASREKEMFEELPPMEKKK